MSTKVIQQIHPDYKPVADDITIFNAKHSPAVCLKENKDKYVADEQFWRIVENCKKVVETNGEVLRKDQNLISKKDIDIWRELGIEEISECQILERVIQYEKWASKDHWTIVGHHDGLVIYAQLNGDGSKLKILTKKALAWEEGFCFLSACRS